MEKNGNLVKCPRCGEIVHIYRNPFLTVDCIVFRNDEGILLIKRRNPPHGWALPGGFVDYGESLEDAAKRELFEETGLKALNMTQLGAYSSPDRDPRFHTVSVVFVVDAAGALKAGDDAAKCRFFPLDNLPNDIAFDHKQIISDFFSWRKRNEAASSE